MSSVRPELEQLLLSMLDQIRNLESALAISARMAANSANMLEFLLRKVMGDTPGRVAGLPPDDDSGSTEALPETPVCPPVETPDSSESENRCHRECLLTALKEMPRPLDGAALARRAFIPYSSYVRKLLSQMIEDEKVIHAPKGGYWLKTRPLPDT